MGDVDTPFGELADRAPTFDFSRSSNRRFSADERAADDTRLP